MNRLAFFTFAASALLLAGVATAQTYPVKPVTMVVPFAAGGPLDQLGRPLSGAMAKHLGQPVIIENIGGAGGNIGVARAARAAADGYTILLHHLGMSTSPFLYRKLDYDPLRDFEYIGLLGETTSTLLARADFPARDLKELIAHVKSNKDKLNFANTGPGGVIHLCSLLFMNAIQTEVQTVSYKSSGLAMNDLLGGRVDMMCDAVSTAAPQIKAGKVKVYGTTGRFRSASLPDIPTLDEQGLKGFEITTWMGLYAPRRTPRPALDRLVVAVQASLRDSDFNATLLRFDYKPASQREATPTALEQRLKSEMEKWGPIIRKAAIQAD